MNAGKTKQREISNIDISYVKNIKKELQIDKGSVQRLIAAETSLSELQSKLSEIKLSTMNSMKGNQ
jgi:hypothetical protein